MKSPTRNLKSAVRRTLNRKGPRPLALEPRLMFDGAMVAAAVTTVDQTDAPAAPEHTAAAINKAIAAETPQIAATTNSFEEIAITHVDEAQAGSTAEVGPRVVVDGDAAANGGRREIAFVDSAVQNWQTLVQGIHAGVEVVLIDSNADGLSQIAQYMDGVHDIDAIHILSHGQEGEVVLGTLHMNASDLSECQDDLATIGRSLKPGGDLLLYGCDIAKNADGLNFIGQLSQLTGADVAASTDTTGGASVGGNWILEASTGAIQTAVVLSADAQANYDGELALPGVHTGSNSSGLFLGGNYIELGIRTNSNIGKFGADTNPGGSFTGRSNASGAAIAGIGMVGDADGFGSGAVLNIDYFMPGTPEEGFYAGYKISGVATTGKNFGTTVTNTSSGNTLSATVTGSIGGNLSVSQAISFDVNDLFFKNTVTVTNTGSSTLDTVRFMRSFDPDNTVDKSGSYSTVNTIERTFAAGDGVAVVSAKSSTGDTYYTRSGSKQATILYYSSDSRAKVGMATSGLAPTGVYDANIYDSSSAKGTTGTYDAYISMAFDAGTLAPGASATFVYYTSLDNRDINTILSTIAAADAKTLPAINEDPSVNAGGTVSSVFGSAVAITAVDNSHGAWQYSSNGGSSWTNFGSVTAASSRLLDSTYSVRFVPNADYNGSSTMTFRVWDGSGFTAGSTADASSAGTHFSANTANAAITVNAVNDAPVLGGAPQTLSYTENNAATAIDTAITVGDVDATNFNGGYLQAQITTNGAAEDQLSAMNQGSGAGQIGISGSTVSFGGTTIGTIDATLNGANGSALKIAFNTSATSAAVQALARVIAYRDSSDNPSTASRTVTFTVNDGGNTGSGGALQATHTAAINLTALNDAPVTSGTVSMTSINEDATTNSGQLISSFFTGSDPDTAPVTGIAITNIVSSHGTWQYSLDNGANWINVGTVSTSSALLLRTSDRVRFIPDGLNGDSASIAYAAWDRTDENGTTIAAGQKVDVTANGGTTAYSSGTQTANLTITAVNDAPTMSSASPTLATIDENATSNGGQTLASILGATISDVDSGAQQGVAITALASGNGTWEYSTNGGSTWTAVGAVAINNALLLRDTDFIRFKPDGNNGTSANFTYKAWDRSSGTQGSKADASTGGGTSAFSTNANTASITVTSVNDAPVLTGAALTLAGITEKDTGNAGQTVASFLGVTMTDVDTGAVKGIAITGLTVAGTGHWEYDAGSGWTTLGSASDATALLLRVTDKIRFVPDGYKGGTGTLTVRGWDTTSGTAGNTADTTTNGGSTAFSTTTETASIAVTDIDDAPSFTNSSGTPTGPTDKTFTEATAPAAASTSTPTAVDTTLLLRDDGAGSSIKSATVTISNGFIVGDILAADVSGTSITASYNAATGVLTLSGNDTAAHYQSVLRSVTFMSASEDPTANSTSRTLSWRATDTSNLTSTAITNTITVIPTADAPTLSNAPTTWTYTEDDGTRIVAPSLSLADLDDTQLSGATVTISGTGYLNDGFELLAALTTGTGITASFDGSTGTLTLSGTDSVANYQKVLRSVTYTNTRDYNNPSAIPSNDFTLDGTTNTRTFSWQVTDANSDGSNGSPSFGAQSSSIANTTVTLVNANEVPQVTDIDGNITHIQYTEGGSATTLEGLLTVHDDGLVSSINSAFVRVTAGLTAGDQLGFFTSIPGWTQTGTPTSGTLDNGSGTVIAYNWSLASGDMSLSTVSGTADQTDYTVVMQHVGFVSTSDDPTAANATRTLIWRVTDSGGLLSAVTSAQSTIIDITAIDDASTVGGLPSSGDITFIEKGAGVAVAPGLTLSDADDTQVSSASVTLSGTGFINSVEYLGLPGVSVSPSSDWSASNVGGSGIDAHYDWASGTLTLSSSSGVSIDAMQNVLRQVTYGSVDNNPTALANTRTLTWTVTDMFGSRITDVPGGNDGDPGVASSPVTSTITISPRNDAPILAGLGGTVSYTEGGSSVTLAGAMTLADADDANLASAKIWISAGFTTGDTLSVSTPGGLTTSFDSATGILTLSGTASKAVYRTALRSIRFSSTSSDPTSIAPNRTMSWTITDANSAGDGALTSSVGSSHINLIATDNAANISGLASAAFTENGSAIAVAPSASLADADDTTLAGLTVTITGGKTSGDSLSVTANLTATGITVTSYNSSTGALVLSGTASLADYQIALRSIMFTSSSDNPTGTSATRTLTWSTVSSFASRLTDNTGSNDASAGVTTANAGTNTINVTELNDAPTLSLNDGTVSPTDKPAFQQGGAPIFVVKIDNPSGGVTAADVDDTQLSGAIVQITDGLSTTDDVLSIATPPGWSKVGNTYLIGGDTITVNYNGSTGTLSLSGNASKANYSTLLGYVQYQNTGSSPTATGADRELTWTITDANSAGDGAKSVTSKSYIGIRDVNDAPQISGLSNVNYTEGASSVALPDIVVTDPDVGEVVTATLTLSSTAVGTLTTPAGSTYDSLTGIWTITDSVVNVNAALAAVAFVPASHNDVNATISINVADGGEDGALPATGVINLNVTAVNDAPVLTPAGHSMTPITEDSVANGGQQISALRGVVSDPDTGASFGIAVTSLTSGTGTWQYSLDGTNWANVGSVSAANALLLRDSDYIRFIPDGNNGATASFDYRAWDRSSGTQGAKVDASVTGNSTPFSIASDTVSILASSVNDAPVLASGNTTLPDITEDNAAMAGYPISSLLSGNVSDVDTGAQHGIAITGLNGGNGTWQFSLDGGTTWSALASASASNALLLRDTDYVRFIPDGNNGTAATFNYRAWDRTSGVVGSTADASAVGGSTAFSIVQNTVSIHVTDVNDAPVLAAATPTLATLTEDDTSNAGQTIASIVGATIGDVDNGALQGIAITQLVGGNGGWQYSTDGGTSWTDVGTVSTTNALLLNSTDKIRFVPDGENATSASFNYRAWDRSTGSAGTTTSVASSGGSTAFSATENTASIAITAVNDAPIDDVVPVFSGGMRVDGTLRQDGMVTASPGTWHDVDLGDPATTFQYQWQVADDANGTNLHNIAGATAINYTLTAAEIGKFVRVKVIGSDGQSQTTAYSAFMLTTNHDPAANTAIPAQTVTQSLPLSLTLPANAFTDADAEDTLYYKATLADGSALPSWLKFDPATLTFSGTPGGSDVGVLNVRVSANDHGNFTATSDFTLRVLSLPVNQPDTGAPIVIAAPPLAPITDVSTPVGYRESPFIRHPDTQPLSVNNTDAPNRATPFASETFTFSHTASGDIGDTKVGGYTRPEGFRIVVEPSKTDDISLLLVHPLTDHFARPSQDIHMSVPVDTFVHSQRDALVTLFALRTNGQPIPDWLHFNAMRGEFHGKTPDGFEDDIEMQVIARDNFGNEASTTFHFRIHKDRIVFKGKPGLSSVVRSQAASKNIAPSTRLH